MIPQQMLKNQVHNKVITNASYTSRLLSDSDYFVVVIELYYLLLTRACFLDFLTSSTIKFKIQQ